MKIIIYGLGRGLEYIENNLREEHEIIGYSDSFSSIQVFRSRPFFKPEQIEASGCDYIVLAIRNRREAWKEYLRLTGGKYQFDRDKVIPFYTYANGEYWDSCMSNADLESLEGLVVGLSYGRYAVLPNYLSRPFVNLCVPMQDLFGTKEVLKGVFSKYGKHLGRLKYIIIDMCDYNYFNYDLSRGWRLFDYFSLGGIVRKHNYDINKNYTKPFEEELFNQLGIVSGTREDGVRKYEEILAELFYNWFAIDKPINEYERWNCIKQHPAVETDIFSGSITLVENEEVIEENIKTFQEILVTIKDFRADMRIVLALFPRYATVDQLKYMAAGHWESKFHEVMSKVLADEYVYFKDYKFCKGVYDNRRLYYDPIHLNTIGGRCMTSIIEEDFKREIYLQ